MKTRTKAYEMDMCTGSLPVKIIVYAIPLMLSGMLQLLFNAADMIVVGRWVGSDALAAVGATSSLINLIINLFIGLAVGVNVLVARFYGAGRNKDLSETVHTAVLTALCAGIFLLFFGILIAPHALRWMDCPREVIGQSTVYLRIYFLGMPVMMLYNYCSGILRAVGDTKRPLYYLTIAGVINVIMNLFFVIVCDMGVAGVAWATTISQAVSAVLVIGCLMRTDTVYRLEFGKIRFHGDKLIEMLKIGLPAGIQSCMFSISNVLIQSSINSFGAVAVAANSAACNLENFVYISNNTFYQSAISFTGQNAGAQKYKRIIPIMLWCILFVSISATLLGSSLFFFGENLLGLYAKEAEVIAIGMKRCRIFAFVFSIGGIMDVIVGMIRGLGYAFVPMLVSLTGICAFRVFWIYTVFEKYRYLETLYVSYPISWTLTSIAHLICFIVVYHIVTKRKERL